MKESKQVDKFSKTMGAGFYRPTTAPGLGTGRKLRDILGDEEETDQKKKFVVRFEKIKEEDEKLIGVDESKEDQVLFDEEENGVEEIRYNVLKREFQVKNKLIPLENERGKFRIKGIVKN